MLDGHRLTYFALFCDLLLTVVVVSTDARRPTNRSFLLFNAVVAAWLVGIDFAFGSTGEAQAMFWIRACSLLGTLVMPCFYLLRLSIVYFQETWSQHLRRAAPWFLSGIALGVYYFSPFYLSGVRLPGPGVRGVPEPIYGSGGPLVMGVYIIALVLILAFLLIRDQFHAQIQGVRRVELQFILLACLVVMLSVPLSGLFQHLLGNAQTVRFAPLRAVVFNLIIAYGITSRGILHVRAVFRILLSYSLLSVYASGIFLLSWLVFRFVFVRLGETAELAPALCSSVLTAVLFNITGTPLRRFTKKILPPDIDFEKIVTDVSHMVQSITTLESLFGKFAQTLARAVGSPLVRVFLCEPHGIREQAIQPGQDIAFLRMDSPISAALRDGADDVTLEELHRQAPSAERDELLAQMERLDSDLVLPIRYQGALSGILTLAPRPSGRIYGRGGRATLRLIAEQLGVAIANARLYTEARQSQAYNQFLVEHLSCGVIATDPAGVLTVINPEARRLLLVDEQSAPADIDLPEAIARLIPPALSGDSVANDAEIILRAGARDQTQLRVSCLPFAGERDRLLGVLLVLNDHTAIDRLQRQVRQADRLASIGTLASGMAHEIKNPLTALKTFAHLLPRRYDDAEFRDSFSKIVGGEIGRIERIVNQLLAFARPAPLMIEQVNLQDVITNATRLIGPQASRHGVELRTSLHDGHDYIAADKDMLQQVILNLMLNALQAIDGNGGWIELASELEPGNADQEPSIRIDVRDSGRGIPPETLSHIFDPFFTTKSEGTGLGLSVSYNIIMEHKGRLEVQSKPGKGACFSIYLPVC